MRYADGTEARCGDLVAYSGHEAVVIANADTMLCVPKYAETFFEFYAASFGNPARTIVDDNELSIPGGLVLTKGVGVVAVFRGDTDLTLTGRATGSTGVKVAVEIRDDGLSFRLETGC